MRILVTGGAGFIGSALIRHLILDTGHSVLNLDKLTYAGNLESLASVDDNPRYQFLQADIADRERVSEALLDFQPDAIMHLAAESHVDRSIDGPAEFIQTNIVGTYQLLEAARAYWQTLPAERRAAFRFHHISTDEVYGTLGETGKFTETTPYAPNSPYSASKAASDHLVRAFHHTYGLPVLTTNIHQALRQGPAAAMGSIRDFRWHIAMVLVFLTLSAGLARQIPQGLMYALLGLPILGFALWQLAGRPMTLSIHHRRRAEIATGIVGGLYGGVSGIWGPPLVVLLLVTYVPALSLWLPSVFR